MNLDDAILQFGGSLVAILMLAGLAYWLRLGGKPTIASAEHAKELASDVTYGFDAIDCAVDTNGKGALLVDGYDRIMVLKPHGSHFVGRILGESSNIHQKDDQVLIDSGERRFGDITLNLPNEGLWIERIKALRSASDA